MARFADAYDELVEKFGLLPSVRMSGHVFTREHLEYLKCLRRTWGDMKAIDIPGDGDDEIWRVKLIHIRTGIVKYFTEPWVAAMFFNRYVITARSSKNPKALNITMKEMARNPNDFGGYRCEIIHEIKEEEYNNAD